MKNKWNQLIISKGSGALRCDDIGYVTLHTDGRMFGRVLTGVLKGAKVVADSYRGKVWEMCDE